MSRDMRPLLLFTASLLLPTLVAPNASARRRPAAGKTADVRIGFSAAGVNWLDPATATAAAKPLFDLLAKRARLSYSIQSFLGEEELRAKVKSSQVNLAFTSAKGYVALSRDLRLLPLARVQINGKDKVGLLLLVRRDKGLKGLKALRGKTVSVFKHNAIARIYLEVLLARAGLGASAAFFGRVQTKKKAPSAVLELFMGESDACLISEAVFDAMIRLNPQLRQRLQTLHTSPAFATPTLFVRADAKSWIREQMQRVAQRVHESKEGRQLLMMFRVQRLVPAVDADYASFRTVWAEHQRITAGAGKGR